MNAHEEALQAVIGFIGNDAPITEVTYKVPFGFHEIIRTNVDIDGFLQPSYNERAAVGILHILLGCGVPLEKLILVVNKALALWDRVLILEHNRASADWDWTNTYITTDHELLNCLTYTDMWNLSDLYGWMVGRNCLIPGDTAPDRNMLIELFGGLVGWNRMDKQEMVQRLGIPIFDTPHAPSNFSHPYDVYVGTAESSILLLSDTRDTEGRIALDEISAYHRKDFQKDILPSLCKQPYTLYACCGGFFSLDHLHMLRDTPIKEINFFDINPFTIVFGKTLIDMILQYPTRLQFLRNYLMTNLVCSPTPSLMDTSWSERVRLYLDNCQFYTEEGIFLLRLLLNGEPLPTKLKVYGLRNCADNRTDRPGYLELTHSEDRYIEENSLKVGQEGWLESDQTYLDTRMLLSRTPYAFKVQSLESLTPNQEDLILASNIFSNSQNRLMYSNCKVIHHGNVAI
jgi:hypothetical protein